MKQTRLPKGKNDDETLIVSGQWFANPIPKSRAAKSAYVTRPSQITRKKPSTRLKKRRTKQVTAPAKGAFPNPVKGYAVMVGSKRIAVFPHLAHAREYGQALADCHGVQVQVVKL